MSRVNQEQTNTYRAGLVSREEQDAVSIVEVASNEDVAVRPAAVVPVEKRANVTGASYRVSLEGDLKRS